MNNPCGWCVKTSEHLDSLEFQVETKDKYIDKLENAIKKLINCEPCNCEDVGFTTVRNRNTGDPEQEQCEFCYLNENSRFNAIEKAKELLK